MTYKPMGDWKVRHWIWAAVVFGMFAVALMWFLWDPFAGKTRVTAPHETTAPSSEWTTAPDGPKVEVDLPETPVTRSPDDGESEAAANTSR